MPKYVFVTGGVMSGLGKGITAASIAKLFQLAGHAVTCVKIDPYLNVDAGTMNPIIHGEVFVTDDGGEMDMDLGTYERFLDSNLTREHNVTTGQVYEKVIQEEREGRFLGKCVQIIPHVTEEIKARIRRAGTHTDADIVIVECGGTVGDIESLPFLEAFRQMRLEEGASNALFVHVTLAPVLETVGEQKTKPTQHSVQELRRIGIQPDVVVVRSRRPLSKDAKQKISLFTSVDLKSVVSNPDVESVYQVPLVLHDEGFYEAALGRLSLPPGTVKLDEWRGIVQGFVAPEVRVRIAMVGKYVTLADSYVSVNHALAHAGAANGVRVHVDWVDAEEFERSSEALRKLAEYDAILVPGGFGLRGTEGKILAANFAREHHIPYLGLCLGFQLATIAFARHVCELKEANSTEFDPSTPHPVIDLLPEQREVRELGGSMRLGGHDIQLKRDSLASELYGRLQIRERHRHRYELNQAYLAMFEAHGLRYTGFSDNGRRAEILELPSHLFYFATQYHPEFVSRPGRAEPAYNAFLKAAARRHMVTVGIHA